LELYNSKIEKNKLSELAGFKNEQNKLELYNSKIEKHKLQLYKFDIEQQKSLSTIHSFTFPTRDSAGKRLRSAENLLAHLVNPFFHSLIRKHQYELNQIAKTKGFSKFSLVLRKNPALARDLIIKKFP
jgi:DNA mismatch repair ATPase MutS